MATLTITSENAGVKFESEYFERVINGFTTSRDSGNKSLFINSNSGETLNIIYGDYASVKVDGVATTSINDLQDKLDDLSVGGISNVIIQDATGNKALISSSGNQKVSIEEIAAALSSNLGKQLNVTPFDSLGNELVDNLTSWVKTISGPHHEAHAGNRFCMMYSVPSLGAMTTPADMITLDFTTPDTTKWGHFTFRVNGVAGWRVRLIEAPSGGATGPTGQFTILNHNRNSLTESTFTDGSTANQINYDSILATGGVTLWDEYLSGTSGPQSGGSSSEERNERILKQNTKYQISLYGTSANPATIYIDWYENTNKV